VTATTSSPRPRAKSISVADGTREAIRTETRMARLSDEEIDEGVLTGGDLELAANIDSSA
jgi:hypothetical protein